MKNNEEKKVDNRARNWSFIQYEDSAPENWRDLLNELQTPWCESPLHDKDLNADGSPKKPHRHIVIACDNKKTYEQAKEYSDRVSKIKPERIKNMVGMLRYLTHKDNPEKAQYSESGIICHCGFELEKYLKRSATDTRAILKEIFSYIRQTHIDSYSEFIDYCQENDLDDWFDVATIQHTLPIKEYIKSHAWKHKVINPKTGEVTYEGTYQMKYLGLQLKK